MSSTLEFRHIAVRIDTDRALLAVRAAVPDAQPRSVWRNGDAQFLVFVEAGCSNCFEVSGRVARNWSLAAVGTTDEVLTVATRVAADYVIGGMVCLRTRAHWTQPESYIRCYRSALERAVPYDAFAARVADAGVELQMTAGPFPECGWRDAYAATLAADEGLMDGAFRPRDARTAQGLADWYWLTACGRVDGAPAYLRDLRWGFSSALDQLAESVKRRRAA